MTTKKKICELSLFLVKQNAKNPATQNGYKDAKVNFDINSCRKRGYNVGLACVTSGLIVLDADVDEQREFNGVETIKNLELKLGELPKTLTVKTPRGGKHYIFSSKGIDNPIGKIGKDVDVKFNGYVIFPPSQINGKIYKFISGVNDNGDFSIAELPQKWLSYLNKGKCKPKDHIYSKPIKQEPLCNVNIEKIISGCKFLQFCKNNAQYLDEPLWFSMITILAQIKNSDIVIHNLSKPYPNYSYKETQQKIDRARCYGKPQTCSFISTNYPAICGNCISRKGAK